MYENICKMQDFFNFNNLNNSNDVIRASTFTKYCKRLHEC